MTECLKVRETAGLLFAACLAAAGAAAGRLGEGLAHYYDFEPERVSAAAVGASTFEIRGQAWDAASSGLAADSGGTLVSKCKKNGGPGAAAPPKDGFGAAYSGGDAASSARFFQSDAKFLCPTGADWTISFWAMRKDQGSQPRLLVNGVPLTGYTADALSAASEENEGFGFYVLKAEKGKVGVRLSEKAAGGAFAVKSILSAQAFDWGAGQAGWHNVMLVRDGAALTLYVDGTAQGVTNMAPGSTVEAPSNGLYTVKEDVNKGPGAANALDDIAVWNRALNADERAAVAEGARPVSAMAASVIRPPRARPGRRPNVVVIMADDLGFGDVSCNTNCVPTFRCRVDTPNIDRLAREGLRFNSGYCSASTCTPTRYSLITGSYAFRGGGHGIAPPNAPALILPGTETVATLMKKAGYATAVFGKWHLGLGWGEPDWNNELTPGPLDIGFDTCLLLPTTNDRVPQVFVKDRRVRGLDPADPIRLIDTKEAPSDALCFYPNIKKNSEEWKKLKMLPSGGHNNTVHNGIPRIGYYTGGEAARFRDEDLASNWVAAADAFIGAHTNAPFFLLVTPHDIHVPRVPNERFQGAPFSETDRAPFLEGKTALGLRGDMIAEFDWTVGEVVDSLEAHGVASNTLVFVLSDNGPAGDDGYKDNAHAKLNATGHQMRGPFRGSDPGKDGTNHWSCIAKGKYSNYEGGTRIPFITYWPGVIAPGGVSDEVVCTIDLAASLAGLVGAPIAANGCLDSLDVMDALLGKPGAKGRESLILQNNNGACALRDGDWRLVGGKELYNLRDDPGERHDLAESNPGKVEELKAKQKQMIDGGRTRQPTPPPPLPPPSNATVIFLARRE